MQREPGDHAAGGPPQDPAPLDQLDPPQLPLRLDLRPDAAASGRIEPRTLQPHLDPWPHPAEDRQKRLLEEVDRRGVDVMRPALQPQAGRFLGDHQGRQDGLEDQRGAAGRAHVEMVLSRPDLAGEEGQIAGIELRALDLCPSDLGRRPDRRQMLPHEPRLGPPGADLLHAERCPGHQRQGQRRPQNLSAPFALGSVDGQHAH